MKRKILQGILMLLVVFCLSACGSDSVNNSEKSTNIKGDGIKAILTVSDGSDTFRATLAAAAKEAADECGMELEILDAEGSSEAQMNHIKDATDADVIICALCDSGTAQQMEVLAGDKPIVFINSCPDEDYLQADHYVYVGSDEAVAGKLQVEYVLDKFSSKSELNIAILKGESTHSATIGRTKANKAALADSGKTINYVFEDYGDWATDTAEHLVDMLLATEKKVDAIICNNDSMAVGAVNSIKNHGLSFEDIAVLGVDATDDGLASIEKDEMVCTIFQPAVGQGEAAVWAAAQLVNGKSITTLEGAEENGLYVWVPFEQVTKENVADYK